jgi:hypothetical protein
VEEEVCFEMGEMVYKKLPILVSGIIDIIPTVLYCTVYFTLTPLTVKLTSYLSIFINSGWQPRPGARCQLRRLMENDSEW